jgi:hypothetical protein
VATAVGLLAAILAAQPIVRVIAAVTNGTRWGDLTVGVGLVAVPAGLAVLLWRLGRPRNWPTLLPWWVLVPPLAVAVGLSPDYHQVVIDASLQALEDARTPGLQTGLAVGEVVAVVIGAASWSWWLIAAIRNIPERSSVPGNRRSRQRRRLSGRGRASR